MILWRLSSLLAIDEITGENSRKVTHFISHYDQHFVVPDDWQSVIYTSAHLAEILSSKKTPIPKKFLRVIHEITPHEIQLSDRNIITVRMFVNGEAHGSAMFYFQRQDKSVAVLYSGPFVECRSILLSPKFRDCILCGIDEMYVDNTRANSTDFSNIYTIASQVEKLLREHPGYTIMMNISVYGHEDLLFLLSTEYKCKIYVDPSIARTTKTFGNRFVSCIKDANIIVGEEQLTFNKLKYRLAIKRLTVQFMECNDAPNDLFTKIGLHLFHWSQHPSLFQLNTLIYFVQPRHLYGIHNEILPLPKCLMDLCKKSHQCENLTETVSEKEGREAEDMLTGCDMLPSLPPTTSHSSAHRNKTDLPRNMARRRDRNRSNFKLIPTAVIKPVTVNADLTTENYPLFFNGTLSQHLIPVLSQETVGQLTPPIIDFDADALPELSLSPIFNLDVINVADRTSFITSTQEPLNGPPISNSVGEKRKRTPTENPRPILSGRHIETKRTTNSFSKRPVTVTYTLTSDSSDS